ncbi:hypothetical protein CVU37_07950 [candidate division BRC1 bacterium HGW-BRC1-1]|jgi:hypothetical protein|nr:MAG: hypothetical protein CVU37_07950 [candidate division BRC1 bacterium HGW-BRC1-1]
MPFRTSSLTEDWTATFRLLVFFLGMIFTAILESSLDSTGVKFPIWGWISLILYASLAWDFFRGKNLWLPARWEFLLAAIIATIISIAWLRFDITLWIWAAVVVAGDIDNRRPARHRLPAIASLATWFIIVQLLVWCVINRPNYLRLGPDASSLIYLMTIAAAATAGLLGYEFHRRRLVFQIVLIAVAVFFAPMAARLASPAAIMAGLATAIFTLIATRGKLVSRRWYRWMFLLGLIALSSTWAMRLSTIHIDNVRVLFGFNPDQPIGVFKPAAVFLVLIPATAAAFTLAGRMRYFSERRSPVRASVALSALVACTVGLIMQPGQLVGVGLPMLVLLCGATGWADRPLHPSEAIQLETHYGPLRLGIRAYGMRKLRAVGIGFGQRS